MKRYDLPQEYIYGVGMLGFILGLTLGMLCGVVICTGIKYGISKLPDLPPSPCTISQEHKQLGIYISEMQQSIEYQISELPLSVNCNK